MKPIKVQLGQRSYPIIIGNGVVKSFNFKKLKTSRFVIITDANVGKLCGGKVLQHLKQYGLPVNIITISAGECAKTWDTVGSIIKQLAKIGASIP